MASKKIKLEYRLKVCMFNSNNNTHNTIDNNILYLEKSI